MAKPMPCAIGLSVHTGWVSCCVVAGDLRTPEILAREIIELLGDQDRFVFHVAAKLEPAEAERGIRRVREDGVRAAEKAFDALVDRMRAQGRSVARCAIVARQGAMLPLEEIVKAHPRIHTAEGVFFRDVLRDAAESRHVATQIFPPRELEALAAKAMTIPKAQLAKLLVRAGRDLGPPWGKDERMASLAAWTALSTIDPGRAV
jgi:hypothetical protein